MSPDMRRQRAVLRSVTGQLLTLVAVQGVIVVAAAIVLVVTLVQWNHQGVATRAASKARADAATTVASVLQQQNAVLSFVVTADPAERAGADGARAAFGSGVATLRAELAGTTAEPLVADLVGAADRWNATVAVPATAAAADGRDEAAEAIVASPASRTTQLAVGASARALWAHLDAAYRTSVAASLDLRARLTGLIIGVLVVLLLSLLGAALILRRSVIVPLRRVQVASRRVADGAWDDSVHVHGPAEVVAVAADVDRMRRALVHALEAERRAAEALDQQGPAVLALRDALAPAPWQQDGFEGAGRLDPVEGLLAGDWYDVVTLGDHRVGIVLGDVAGHGAASGVYALRLKGMLRGALLAGQSPATALSTVAAIIAEFPDNARVASGELFATVFLAVADREVGSLVYASAGHLDAVVMRAVAAAGSDPVPPYQWDSVDLPPTGPMLSALLADRIWTERRHRFAPNDLLIAATDGVIEARDPADDLEFGTGRIVGRVGARLREGDTLAAAVDAVFSDVAGFERRARDDRTLVALRLASTRRRFDATRVGSARPLRPV
ncbi:PP2C family protein-serine/threonine phosphatase [Jatrophihabitans sp. YIM 134969]